jgi:fructokinase
MDIVALGEALIDFSVSGADEAGYPLLQAKPGGAPANFLSAATAFGASTAMLAKVGTDVFGQLLRKTMDTQQLSTDYVLSDPNFFTTLAFVTLDSATGERQFSFARKPGADTQLRWEEIRPMLDSDFGVFHFGTLSLTGEPAKTTTQQAVAAAKAGGKVISFDPNLRVPLWDNLENAREQMLWGLQQADVVKISDEEIDFLFHTSVENGIRKIADTYGTKVIFGTAGRTGCAFLNQNGTGFCPAFQVRSVDATGAGDIFGGTAMAMLLRQRDRMFTLSSGEMENVVRTASAAAALSTMYYGGISSIQPEADVLRFLKENTAPSC